MSGLIKLHVGSLPFNIRDADLKCMFSKYGTPYNAHVVIEKENQNYSSNFGYVEFETKEEADAAIAGLNETPLGHGQILVKYAVQKTEEALQHVTSEGLTINSLRNGCSSSSSSRKRKLATVSRPLDDYIFQSNKKFAFETSFESPTKTDRKIFNDPIHGHFELPVLLLSIIDTPQFQRLRHIKQLSGCYMVFPGASHNRFEHSLGVAYLAGRLCQTLQKRQPELNLTQKDITCVQIAGLCHDLGHGPFSHLFDNLVIPIHDPNSNWKHEQGSVDMFNHMLSENNLESVFEEQGFTSKDMCFIRELIAGPIKDDQVKQLWPYLGREEEKSFLYEVVANKRTGVDVDKWDYFLRDCHHLGISNNFDYKRFLKFARVLMVDGKLQICTRDKEVITLYDMFHTRNSLHRRAYQHKTVKIIDFMISDVILKANDHLHLPGTDGKMVKITDCIYDMKAYTHLNDEILTLIQISKDESLKSSQDVLRRIQCRDLYKYVGQTILSKPITKDDIAKIKNEIVDILKVHTVESNNNDFCLDDIVIHLVDFDYGMKDTNPIDKVRFYTKLQPDNPIVLSKSQVSQMLPECFAEQHLRCYCKSNELSFLTLLHRAFGEWKNSYL